MRAAVAPAIALSFLLSACSSAPDAAPSAATSTHGGSSGSGESATTGTDRSSGAASSGSGSGDAGNGAGNAGASCDELHTEAHAIIDPVLAAASADLACTADSDCVFVLDGTACTEGCGLVTTTSEAAKVTAATNELNSGACAEAHADACEFATGGDCPRNSYGAVCVANACTSGTPAAWTSLVVSSTASGTIDGTTVCPGATCETRTITPDGAIVVAGSATATNEQLSDEDFAAVDAILRSASFRQEEFDLVQAEESNERYVCPGSADAGAPFAGDVAFQAARPNAPTLGGNIGTCLAAGETNDFVALYRIVQAYK